MAPLSLQLNGYDELMLTEDEYLSLILHHFPDAVVRNVKIYRNYFNNNHKSMGFRGVSAMPTPVRFKT